MTEAESPSKQKEDPDLPRLIDQIDAPPAPPCTLVIFGASGDLTDRLLVPAPDNLRRPRSLGGTGGWAGPVIHLGHCSAHLPAGSAIRPGDYINGTFAAP